MLSILVSNEDFLIGYLILQVPTYMDPFHHNCSLPETPHHFGHHLVSTVYFLLFLLFEQDLNKKKMVDVTNSVYTFKHNS